MNYYELLGVLQDDNLDTIRQAYRRLATLYHPDSNSEEAQKIPLREREEKIRQINEAFDVLKDPDARKRYNEELQRKNTQRNGSSRTGSQQQNPNSPPPQEDPTLQWTSHDYALAMARCISKRETLMAQKLFEQMLDRDPSSQFDQTDIAHIFDAWEPAIGAADTVMLAFTIANTKAQRAVFLDREKFAQLVGPSIRHGSDPNKPIYKNPVFRNHFKEYRTIMDLVKCALDSGADKDDLKKNMIEKTIAFWQGHLDIAVTDDSSTMQDSLLRFFIQRGLYSSYGLAYLPSNYIVLLSEQASENAVNEAVQTIRDKSPPLNTFLALSAMKKDTDSLTSALRMNFQRAIFAAKTPEEIMSLFSYYENDFRLNGTLGGYGGGGKSIVTMIMSPINSENPDRESLKKMGKNLGQILSNQRFIQEVGPHHFVNNALNHMKKAVQTQLPMMDYSPVYEAFASGAAKAVIPKVKETIFKVKNLLPSVLPLFKSDSRKPDDQINQVLQKIENARQEFLSAVPEMLDPVSKVLRNTAAAAASVTHTSDPPVRTSQEESFVDRIIREWREKNSREG